MRIIVLFFIVTAFASCAGEDKKPEGTTGSENTKVSVGPAGGSNDSANFTQIEWIDSVSQDLGQLKQGRVVEITYRFKNAGSNNLIISDVRAGCGCTIPEKPEEPIAPGAEGVIKAKFDSKGQHVGENKKYVSVVANTPKGTTELSFRVEITE